MRIDILTLFPEMFKSLDESIIGRARENGVIEINIVDIRDFAKNKHKKCDDYSFGGGAGMLMTPQPIADAILHLDSEHKARRIYMSPKGRVFKQADVGNYIGKHLILLCGHYEGVDQRVIDLFIDEEISIGDYVLTGGELPAMVFTDCIARYVEGVIAPESLEYESISSGLLEYPQYTRPQEFMGLSVPEVLISGDHQKVDEWRREKSKELTKNLRPDLLEKK